MVDEEERELMVERALMLLRALLQARLDRLSETLRRKGGGERAVAGGLKPSSTFNLMTRRANPSRRMSGGVG